MTTYHASPLMRCQCPAKTFTSQAAALEYAKTAARTFGIGYRVWQLNRGRIRSVATANPGP